MPTMNYNAQRAMESLIEDYVSNKELGNYEIANTRATALCNFGADFFGFKDIYGDDNDTVVQRVEEAIAAHS